MTEPIKYFGTGKDAGDNSFLSNFYWCDGWTVEHLYQAAKTDDPKWMRSIMSAETPGEAKKIGRRVPLRPTWEEEKLGVMKGLLLVKFTYKHMAEKLLATGDAELIEGNWWGDTFWGVCKGKGENHLGRLLMNIRETLR